eukprot:CAMPEP_0182596612 /NCGR_PEP_ID=MMETSP1324-20130603/84582_1 /TAXON_ID=236786 /ORGANISM="Florenciella sp., Strain RCC1587" /LENGTH=103 /DNA_ID=CAMNT_0024814303 /DNA_START=23 /DNA_END=334 /DNA_ORIENTATION=-
MPPANPAAATTAATAAASTTAAITAFVASSNPPDIYKTTSLLHLLCAPLALVIRVCPAIVVTPVLSNTWPWDPVGHAVVLIFVIHIGEPIAVINLDPSQLTVV